MIPKKGLVVKKKKAIGWVSYGKKKKAIGWVSFGKQSFMPPFPLSHRNGSQSQTSFQARIQLGGGGGKPPFKKINEKACTHWLCAS